MMHTVAYCDQFIQNAHLKNVYIIYQLQSEHTSSQWIDIMLLYFN